MSGLVRSLRWLVIPAAVFLLIMVGMALSSAPRPDAGDQEGQSEGPVEASENPDDSVPSELDPTQSTTEAPSVTVTSGDVSVEVRFDPDGVARVSVDGQDGEFDLVPGTGSGVRINPDGGVDARIEPMPTGMIGPDDLALTPTGDGVDVHAPDSPLVELRPDGRTGGVSATEFDGETANSLTGVDGTVTLGDGTTIAPIELPGDGLGQLVVASVRDLPWRWIVAVIATLAITSALTGYLLHRNHTEPNFSVTMTLDWATDDTEDFDGFLERLTADSDPTRAIRLAFHAVEQGLSGLPVRNDQETPFEWHRRASEVVPSVESTLGDICDLYAKARFAPGRATDEDRNRMVDYLRTLVHGEHAPHPTTTAESR